MEQEGYEHTKVTSPYPADVWWHILSRVPRDERNPKLVCRAWRECVDACEMTATKDVFDAYNNHELTISLKRSGCGAARWRRWTTTERQHIQTMVVDLHRCIAKHIELEQPADCMRTSV